MVSRRRVRLARRLVEQLEPAARHGDVDHTHPLRLRKRRHHGTAKVVRRAESRATAAERRNRLIPLLLPTRGDGEVEPDIHIYTRSKLPWVRLPENALAVEAYYDSSAVWPAESLERRRALFG